MLKHVLAAFLFASLVTGQAAAAGKKTNPPAGQSEPDDREGDARPQRGPAPPPPPPPGYAPPGYAPPAYAQPAPAAGRYFVLTEQQKRCGVQRRCELDSRNPCPPCW